MTRAFLDTNVLIYAFEGTPKSVRAKALLEHGGVISTQSLNEFANAARRKLGFEWQEVREAVDGLLTFCPYVVELDVPLHRAAVRIAERYRLSVYDAQIAAAALAADCSVLLSEDMHDGLVIDGRLTIRNPFA